MAYDLQEQESLDELKAWWEKWGNLVLSVITVVCLAFAGYNGMKWWERHQAQKPVSPILHFRRRLCSSLNLLLLRKLLMR